METTLSSMNENSTYHIYFQDKCIFKNLSEDDFHFIWGKLYTSSHKEEITYTFIEENPTIQKELSESSY